MDIMILDRKITIPRMVLIVAALMFAFALCYTGLLISRRSAGITFQTEPTQLSAQQGASGASGSDAAAGTSASAATGISAGKGVIGNNTGSSYYSGSTASSTASTRTDTAEIKVYVLGCVKKPGVVTLHAGQLVCDAIEAAGGISADADIYNINLVYPLTENLMIKILSKSYQKPAASDNKTVKGAVQDTGKGAVIVKDTGEGISAIGGKDTVKSAKVDINSATSDEFDTLPGIGKSTAGDIIAYRTRHGVFKKIEDIMNVPGIKQNKFDKIKDFIRAG